MCLAVVVSQVLRIQKLELRTDNTTWNYGKERAQIFLKRPTDREKNLLVDQKQHR